MINCRLQIYEALKQQLPAVSVKSTRPEGALELPLVVYAEITNVTVSRYVDQIEYQIDGYAESLPEVIRLCQAVDDVMSGLGWTRTYITPDSQARQAAGLYKKAANYRARIDTRINNIITG